MALGSRYEPLSTWLATTSPEKNCLQVNFEEIERLIERPLPKSARTYRAWWSNDRGGSHSHALSWMEAGWRVARVDLDAGKVEFCRGGRPATVQEPVLATKPERPRAPDRTAAGQVIRVRVARSASASAKGASSVVTLVACASTKVSRPCAAKDLYVSTLFNKSRAYAEKAGRQWFILSAKHGLLDPNEVIEPYDLTLKDQTRSERRVWASLVFSQLKPRLSEGDTVVFLAGATYRQDLEPLLLQNGYRVETPMEGLRIGEQLQFLSEPTPVRDHVSQASRDLERFYDLLSELEKRLGGKRLLGECHGGMRWPERGLYFFFEPGELRGSEAATRVVRVGTHAVSRGSKSTLWGRLRQHKGHQSGGGNHRGSIFRLHVGMALQRRFPDEFVVPSWGRGTTPRPGDTDSERSLEQAVSEVLGRMSVLWLEVDDESSRHSHRASLERNSIGLLTCIGAEADPPSGSWLGRYSARPEIQKSGLWNLNHVFDRYDPDFLDLMEEYVDRVEAR